MAFTETIVGTMLDVQAIAQALNTAFQQTGLGCAATYTAAADYEASYAAGNGKFEVATTGENPHTIASYEHTAAYQMTGTIIFASSSSVATTSGSATSSFGTVSRVYAIGRSVLLVLGRSLSDIQQQIVSAMLFTVSNSGEVIATRTALTIATSTTPTATAHFPATFNSWLSACSYSDEQASYAAMFNAAGTAGTLSAFYRGNFLTPFPMFTQSNEPQYLADVFLCSVCQYYDKPTYAEVSGKRYLFLAYIAILDEDA